MTKTGFIAIVGRPNVGKSTLLNAILGEKVAIVSKKPQTTRNRITGILTEGENQFVFLDTPGMHKPRTRLGDFMVKTVSETLGGIDGAILVVEAREAVGDIEAKLLSRLKKDNIPTVLVINKTDTVQKANIAKTIAAYAEAHAFHAVIPVSAKHKRGIDIVIVTDFVKVATLQSFSVADDVLLADKVEVLVQLAHVNVGDAARYSGAAGPIDFAAGADHS